jgi:hypothetical protein
VGVAAVDDDVALLEQRHQLVDDRVGAFPRLDHHDDAAGFLEGCDELLEGRAGHEAPLGAELADQVVDPALSAVVERHGMPVTSEVARQVTAHDRKAGDADLSLRRAVHPGSLSLLSAVSQNARQQMATH